MESPTKNPLDIVKGSEQEFGPLLGIFVILILVVAGALYSWMNESNRSPKNPTAASTTEIVIYEHPQASASTTAAASTSASEASTSSDDAELNAIENSLENQTQNVNNLNF